MLALFIPWFLLFVLFVVIVLLIRKKWKASIILFVVMLALNWWYKCIPFRLYGLDDTNDSSRLKIMCFNIDGSSGDVIEKAKNIKELIKKLSPNIVFIAEFNEQFPKPLHSALKDDFAYTTYPGHLFFQYFYSNYPLFNSRRLKDSDGKDVGVYACCTVIQGDTIDLYGCHFASNNYNELYERQSIEDISSQESLLTYINNIQTSGNRRTKEAIAIVHEMSKSSHQAIVLGDMNDVGGSAAIRALKTAGLTDAWLEGGFWYGATIHYPLPYRIDHILYNEGLVLKGVKVIDTSDISDHNALVAVFDLSN